MLQLRLLRWHVIFQHWSTNIFTLCWAQFVVSCHSQSTQCGHKTSLMTCALPHTCVTEAATLLSMFILPLERHAGAARRVG